MFIIAGPNGAGKTTASFTILPELLDCKEFVNADEIARGLSPFQPEKAAIAAGRLMIDRIQLLLSSGADFAVETTLAGRYHKDLVVKARAEGYHISMIFFWLESVELAIQRVEYRVLEGGHDIPISAIKRRYTNGLSNFFEHFIVEVDNWMFFDNSRRSSKLVAKGRGSREEVVNKVL